MPNRRFIPLLIIPLFTIAPLSAATYYVSSSTGSDTNNGTSQATPFASIAHVNTLALLPGDQVLFKCGDQWRGESLLVTRSGSTGADITYGSYPAGCTDKPILSGAFPVTGWSNLSGNLYMADLNAGSNAGNFSAGINQVFRGDDRLLLGRYPNVGEGDQSDGYATIDNPAANADTIVDNDLPTADWTGAVAHIKGMRWYIINRTVTGSSGPTLNLNLTTDCWDGSCQGWGYFLNNHLATLDRDGEWFYDTNTGMLYLYSTSGTPNDIEASPILGDPDRWQGGIVLGVDFFDHIADVTIENLCVRRWFMHGVTTPLNWRRDDNRNLILRDLDILDVDAVGINLAGYVYEPNNGIPGWRGGHNLLIEDNWIRGAHQFGINSYAYNTTIQNNRLEDIGQITTAGIEGLGCGDDQFGGFCTEFGDGIRIKLDHITQSAHSNLIQHNRLMRVGYNGIDVFGPNNILRDNLIRQATSSKSDGGGIRTYGTGFIGSSPVTNLTISGNLIVDLVGNTDGANPTWRSPFGFGIYIDNFSESIAVTDNTVVNATASGILFQNATGQVQRNTVFNSSNGTSWSAGLLVSTDVSSVSSVTDNVFYGLHPQTWTMRVDNPATVADADRNFFFNPFKNNHIYANNSEFSLAQWRTFSGMDAASQESWFELNPEDPPVGRIFYNDTEETLTVDLGASLYLDLDQNPVTGSLTLAPYRSQVLILESECAPTATLSGDAVICAGQSATLQVALTGTPPWSLVWSDGFPQNNITTSPAIRTVSPTQTTSYGLSSVNDSQCGGIAGGGAVVTVNAAESTGIQPATTAQGQGALSLDAGFDCNLDVLTWSWILNGDEVLGVDVDPLVVQFTQPGVHTLTLELTTTSGAQSADAVILVPNHANIIADPNGDGCHNAADVAFHAPAWRNASKFDPDGTGTWDIRDYLYINTGAGYPPCLQ